MAQTALRSIPTTVLVISRGKLILGLILGLIIVGQSVGLNLGLTVGLGGLLVGFIDILRFEWLSKRLEIKKNSAFWWDVINVVIVGLIFGLSVGGGLAFLQHFSLRFILWRTGQLPYRLVPFLNYCAERIFLRKVGGGYIFVHRMLLEYFAGLEAGE